MKTNQPTTSVYPNGYFNPKPCRQCSDVFVPKSPSHMYCQEDCAKKAKWDRYYLRNYGVGYDHVQMMLTEQDHRCAICKCEGFIIKDCHTMSLAVDHCHDTGRVRGLLCHNCNRALGLLKDDPDVLRTALEYISD
jgi:hypothetical protein